MFVSACAVPLLQLETARLYQQAGVNPLAGCLPTLATIPVFIGLYRALTLAAQVRAVCGSPTTTLACHVLMHLCLHSHAPIFVPMSFSPCSILCPCAHSSHSTCTYILLCLTCISALPPCCRTICLMLTSSGSPRWRALLHWHNNRRCVAGLEGWPVVLESWGAGFAGLGFVHCARLSRGTVSWARAGVPAVAHCPSQFCDAICGVVKLGASGACCE